jgi:hypothetical protein
MHTKFFMEHHAEANAFEVDDDNDHDELGF